MKKLGKKINTSQESVEAYVYCQIVCDPCSGCSSVPNASSYAGRSPGTYSHY